MKSAKRDVLAVLAIAAIAGCESTGLSMREGPTNNQSEYVNALYSDLGAANATTPARPFIGPARLAVAQVGETAPPQVMLDGLKKAPELFSSVEVISAAPEGYSGYYHDQNNQDGSGRRKIDMMCRQALSMNMDYLLLIGGTIDGAHNGTPLSVLNMNNVGIWIVPSEQ